jgi:hypothetical protein
MFFTSLDQGIRHNGRLYIDFCQDMTNVLTWGTYTSPKTTEVQPVAKAVYVSKEGWKINHFNNLYWNFANCSSAFYQNILL